MILGIIPNIPDGGYTAQNVLEIGVVIGNALTGFAIAGAMIVLLYGAILYFMGSTGSEDKSSKGKTMVLWAVVGIIVMILARVIVVQIVKIIQPNLQNVNPEAQKEVEKVL